MATALAVMRTVWGETLPGLRASDRFGAWIKSGQPLSQASPGLLARSSAFSSAGVPRYAALGSARKGQETRGAYLDFMRAGQSVLLPD
ncbi:hypothetical protein GCM10023084_62380 [Streptomyces lacrimifluminis]|uniref:Uncharacterized protein n=1 Tax=Streptomyces lacrimifluminis TaxID=1500077 RepID=A0A917L4Q4_9ACTN|nr:hypothetical protein GCM10012282_43430 [Streptomyces lacrimifluminis]